MSAWRLSICGTWIVRRHLETPNKWQLYWGNKWHRVPLDQQGNPDFDLAHLTARRKELASPSKREGEV